MEDEDAILRKADALLRRHAPPKALAGQGEDIPILTDLITPGGALETPAELNGVPGPEEPGAAGAGDARPADLIDEITFTLQTRLAQHLERRLKEHRIAEAHPEVATALQDFERDIADAVGEVVAEALARRPLP